MKVKITFLLLFTMLFQSGCLYIRAKRKRVRIPIKYNVFKIENCPFNTYSLKIKSQNKNKERFDKFIQITENLFKKYDCEINFIEKAEENSLQIFINGFYLDEAWSASRTNLDNSIYQYISPTTHGFWGMSDKDFSISVKYYGKTKKYSMNDEFSEFVFPFYWVRERSFKVETRYERTLHEYLHDFFKNNEEFLK